MPPRPPQPRLLVCLTLLTLLALACGGSKTLPGLPASPIELATFSENGVAVTIWLEGETTGEAWLAATFTPLEAGFHLYSKDTPLEGINGLGRPTLLELTPNSKLTARGGLTESIAPLAKPIAPDQQGLLVYPDGPVTLRLPVNLPASKHGTVADEVSVTYMVCNEHGCKKPVVGKIVPVSVPASEK